MEYSIVVTTPEKNICVSSLNELRESGKFNLDGFVLTYTTKDIKNIKLYEFSASGKGKCFISLCGKGSEQFYSFDGIVKEERILRQSPHDPHNFHFKIDGTAVPMIAACNGIRTDVFVSDAPAFCDNYTTQHIIPDKHEFFLSSGDPGGTPNYTGDRMDDYFHDLSEKDHVYRFIYFKTNSVTLKSIRRDMFKSVNEVWGKGGDSAYHAVSFSSNYMHYRRNETKTSDYWVVAGIQYANTQYNRDSFWQCWILPEDMSEQSYMANSSESVLNAENALFFVIWSYEVFKNGGKVKKDVCDVAYKKIIDTLNLFGDGRYCPPGLPDGSYRNWFDICCYEKDDADAYSQGLCVCALNCAKELGYETYNWKEKVIRYYMNLYNGDFVQMSMKKPYLALDYTVGELLNYVLFKEKFIPDEYVQKTYAHIMQSKANTPYGVKIVSDVDGSYLTMDCFGAYGHVNPEMARMELGRYANGGSYHIYEQLFHIAAYIHDCEGALDNMIRRLMIDLDYDGATHEYMHTLKGNGVKANQGWNAVICAMWDRLLSRGEGDIRYFVEADKKLDSIV